MTPTMRMTPSNTRICHFMDAGRPTSLLSLATKRMLHYFRRARFTSTLNYISPIRVMMSSSKRKALPGQAQTSPKKRPRVEVPEYHLTPSIKQEDGSIQWPAPEKQMERAREIILECAKSQKKVLIVPDKDADGLSAGAILRHTLLLLGVKPELIHVHLLSKGNNVHSQEEREQMAVTSPGYIFVIDQGSRPGPSLIEGDNYTGLVIDHHYATEDDFPTGSEHVTACSSPPVATSALLTYTICQPLHADVAQRCDWLCVVGTHGDLGNTIKWQPPFPDMKDTFKRYTKKTLNDVVSLVNAPRRTATFDVISAFEALCDTSEPANVLSDARLLAARAEVNAEVERCTHTAPKFSADGKIAAFRIRSVCQVHPVIATRWAGHLNSKALEIVLVANEGYVPGKVNFSCRIARCARSRDPPVNIIESLKAYASLPNAKDSEHEDSPEKPPLLERLGNDFARGHVQASGGIVKTEEFEELMSRMQVGVKNGDSKPPATKSRNVVTGQQQKNTLLTYFKKT